MGTALMGTGEADGDKRALRAAETAIANPLLDEMSMRGAKGLLISITGSFDMTLYEVEEATSRVRREIDPDSNPDINIIMGAIFDHSLEGRIRVSVVATGINAGQQPHVVNAGEKSSRLVDRIGVPQRESEKPISRSGNDAGESWQGSGNVTIEPRSPKYLVNSPAPARSGKPVTPQFEPQAPAKPIRPPRRPLTGKDFPELAEHEAEMQDRYGAPAHQFKRKGGLLDWVTGRGRPDESQTPERMPPTLEPARPVDDKTGPGNPVDDRAANSDAFGRDQKATGRSRNAEEPLEMPKFLKRPLN
jgi:cell division protein FtsZ